MKNTYLIIALLCFGLTGSMAQKRQSANFNNCNDQNRRNCVLNDLSEEQKDKMQAEKTSFFKETQQDKNQLGELKARLKTVSTTEPVDQKELNSILSEMNTISTSMHKKRIRHMQNIKSFLSDEQVLAFESRKGKPGSEMGFGRHNNGHHGRKGQMGQNRGKHNQKGRMMRNNSCLSEELREQMKAVHTDLLKKQQPLNNKLNELNAQLKTQTSGKNIDLKKVDKIIDQQAELKLELAKLKASTMMDLRASLNDEQKVWFDNKNNHHKRNYRRN